MTPDLWRLPGSAAWLATVLSDFDDGAFLVLRLPRTWEASGLHEAFRAERPAAWLEFAEVDEERGVAGALRDLTYGAPSAEDALERLRADGTVPWLRIAGPLDADALSAVAEGHARLEATPASPVVLEHLGPLAGPRLRASPTLRVHSLFAVFTTLDTKVLLRQAAPGLSESRVEEVAELAAHDVRLATELARLTPASHDAYVSACRRRAEELGFAGEPPELPDAARAPEREPGVLDSIWHTGAVDRFNGQLVLHPGIASDDDVDRRLWRGQIRALLPMLDELRLRLLDEAHRRGIYPVPARGETIELGDLLRSLEGSRQHSALADAARQLTRARNELAHLKLVDEARRARMREALRRARLPEPAGL